MKTRNVVASLGLLASSLITSTALAYPIDPAKVPVSLPQDPNAARDFTLAYDTDAANVVYYAPKTGRVATLNNQALVGFAILPTGDAYLNAQFEFGVFGADRQRLMNAITAAGKTPVVFPYRRTRIVPLTPGFDPNTGERLCVEVEDPSTGEMVTECEETIYKEVLYTNKGPALGENVALTATLNMIGAAVYRQFLRSGNALQINLEGEYFAAGTAFEATVRVSYDKLFENFRSYASFHGFWCTDIQVETFFQKEVTCEGRRPEECGVWIEYRDLATGQVTTTATIDPDNREQQEKILQAAERLADQLRNQMLTPIQQALGPLDRSRPTGFKLDAKYERQKRGMNASFSFRSPRGVNVKETVVPVALGCVIVADNGTVSRDLQGDCGGYWQ